MNIDELSAGRELDALVAQGVMGWKRTGDLTDKEVAAYIKAGWQSDREPTREDIHHQRIRWIIGGECDHASWMRPDGLPVTETGLPHYSESMTATWDVVRRITNSCSVSLRLVGPRFADGYLFKDGWHAAFVDANYALTDIGEGTVAETPALAICRAALKMVTS